MRGYGAAFWMLMVLASCLFAFGFVHGTSAQQLVQAAPLAVAMLLILTEVKAARRFAAAVFLVWLAVAVWVWIPSGILPFSAVTFSPLERGLAAATGVVALIGATAAFRWRAIRVRNTIWTRVLFFLLGLTMQVVAIQLSLGPLFRGW
jgi:hypothetical protein